MRAEKFTYEISVDIYLDLKEAALLKLIAEHHYDSACRMSGESGPINGLFNCASWASEGEEHAAIPCTFRDIDTMCKVLEQTHVVCNATEDRELMYKLQAMLSLQLERINQEYRRLHPKVRS